MSESRVSRNAVSPLAAALATLTVAAVTVVQRTPIAATNFGGVDEWLYLDLTSRGVLEVPYAHRPLVLLWHAVAARLWPGELQAFAVATTLYLAAVGLLTAGLARRLAPADLQLSLLAGVAAAAWAPLDYLRLDTVLICGYAGFTFATAGALVCFVESWHRNRPTLLAVGILLGLVAALGVESVLPVLALAPALLPVWRRGSWRDRRVAVWVAAWWSSVALAAILVAAPLLRGEPSYQAGALGLDPRPLGIASRVGRLLAMQATPLLTSPLSELANPWVWAAVAAFVAGALAVRAAAARAGTTPEPARVGRLAVIGLLLAVAGHAALALTPRVSTPARTQLLSAPGFALALAAAVGAVRNRLPGRLRFGVALAGGCWIVAVGTGRVVAMQAEWDTGRSLYPAQRSALASLTAQAPALAPGTLVLLLDDAGAFPVALTFRHAVRYLYGDSVVGLVAGAEPFLYPYGFLPQGVTIQPWPVIRAPWRVEPTLHGWDTIVVVQRTAQDGVRVLDEWPGSLPALPAGGRYAPRARIGTTAVRTRERRVLIDPRAPVAGPR